MNLDSSPYNNTNNVDREIDSWVSILLDSGVEVPENFWSLLSIRMANVDVVVQGGSGLIQLQLQQVVGLGRP